jgi:hypothetical protein
MPYTASLSAPRDELFGDLFADQERMIYPLVLSRSRVLLVNRTWRSLPASVAEPNWLKNRLYLANVTMPDRYSNAKMRFQSFFMLMMIQPSFFASS